MANSAPPADDPRTTLYQEICKSYNAINDWRAKLLGFLPLASGAGIFFLLNNSFMNVTNQGKNTTISTPITQYLLPIGIVGAIITLGLFFYDIRAIQVRRSLIEAGKEIEDSLRIHGQFRMRPHSFGRFTNDLLGSTLIYFAIIAGWIFFGLVFHSLLIALIVAGSFFVIGVLVVYIINLKISFEQDSKNGEWQHIENVRSVKDEIDGLLELAKKQYESLLQAQTRPSVVDDATLNRIITIFTYQRNDLWSYDKQFARWKKKKLTPAQRNDVKSLADQLQKLQKMNTDILSLLNKLKLMVCVNANAANDNDGGMSRNHDSESMSEV